MTIVANYGWWMRNSTRYASPTIGRGIELQKRENEWLSTIFFFERSKQEIKKEYQNKKEKRINRALFFFRLWSQVTLQPIWYNFISYKCYSTSRCSFNYWWNNALIKSSPAFWLHNPVQGIIHVPVCSMLHSSSISRIPLQTFNLYFKNQVV